MDTILVIALVLGVAAPPSTPASVAVLPLGVKGKAHKDVAAVLDDLLLSEVQRQLPTARVIGRSDIDSMIGFEKTKEMVGCDQLACMADIAGALGVDTIIAGNIGQLGQKYVLSLAWIDQKAARVIRRNSGDLGRDENLFDVTMRQVILGLVSPGNAPDQTAPVATNAYNASGCVPGAARQCQEECSADVFSSCTTLARMFIQGNGVIENAASGRRLLEKACEGGNIEGCADLAGILEQDSEHSESMTRALRLYVLACKGGNLVSCGQAGLAYIEGRGTAPDAATGVASLEKACAGALPKYCARLGGTLAEGRGVPQDLTKATAVSSTACEGGSAEGCYVLGSLLATEGSGRDLSAARKAFEKSCASGFRAGCQNLGLFERDGLGGPRAPAVCAQGSGVRVQ